MIQLRPKLSLSRAELLALAKNELAFYGVDLGRLSSVLIAQLFQLRYHCTVNIFNITNEIKALEGIGSKTCTHDESRFKARTPLEGLYHTHFTDARFVLQNIAVELGFGKRNGSQQLNNIIGRLFREHMGEYVDDGFALKLAHEISFETYKRRASRRSLTGEWIVFSKHKDKRYYLCLAAHEEDDEIILERAEAAKAMDFPFIVWRDYGDSGPTEPSSSADR